MPRSIRETITSLGASHAAEALHQALVDGGHYRAAGPFVGRGHGNDADLAAEYRRRCLEAGIAKSYQLAGVTTLEGLVRALADAGIRL